MYVNYTSIKKLDVLSFKKNKQQIKWTEYFLASIKIIKGL